MKPAELRRAAYWLSVNAEALRSGHTLDGAWGNEHEAKAEHDECVALARKLRAEAKRRGQDRRRMR